MSKEKQNGTLDRRPELGQASSRVLVVNKTRSLTFKTLRGHSFQVDNTNSSRDPRRREKRWHIFYTWTSMVCPSRLDKDRFGSRALEKATSLIGNFRDRYPYTCCCCWLATALESHGIGVLEIDGSDKWTTALFYYSSQWPLNPNLVASTVNFEFFQSPCSSSVDY